MMYFADDATKLNRMIGPNMIGPNAQVPQLRSTFKHAERMILMDLTSGGIIEHTI